MMISHAGGIAIKFECAPDKTFQLHPDRGLLMHANRRVSAGALGKLRDVCIRSTPDSLFRDLRMRDLLGHQRLQHYPLTLNQCDRRSCFRRSCASVSNSSRKGSRAC